MIMPNWPTDTQRISIVGRTGSGKSVAGLFHLSRANWHQQPYVVYDFKRDSLIAEIEALEGAVTLPIGEVPHAPGLYIVHPLPHESDLVEVQMWRIWEQGYTGVYADEGYMVCGPANSNSAFRALLTQGRSKHIPIIINSQRPVWLDRFVFSESDFYQIFQLNHAGDRKKMMEYIPAKLDAPLPAYHSYYHDVAAAETYVLKPVPKPDEIVAVFNRRLKKMIEKPPRKARLVI